MLIFKEFLLFENKNHIHIQMAYCRIGALLLKIEQSVSIAARMLGEKADMSW